MAVEQKTLTTLATNTSHALTAVWHACETSDRKKIHDYALLAWTTFHNVAVFLPDPRLEAAEEAAEKLTDATWTAELYLVHNLAELAYLKAMEANCAFIAKIREAIDKEDNEDARKKLLDVVYSLQLCEP